MRLFQVATLNKVGFSEPEFFLGRHLSCFLIYGINAAFFQGRDQKKSVIAEPEIFLWFETEPDF